MQNQIVVRKAPEHDSTVNFRQSSEAKQQPIFLQQPRYLRAQHILSLVASARSAATSSAHERADRERKRKEQLIWRQLPRP